LVPYLPRCHCFSRADLRLPGQNGEELNNIALRESRFYGEIAVRKENRMQAKPALKSDLDCLLDLNHDYIRSVQSSDVARFREILGDDFLCSQPDGTLQDREAFLKHTAVPAKIANLAAQDVMVRILGDVAIIHARTTYTMPDGRSGAGRYTDVWARRNGRWLAVSAHVTRC
jgi:ketosteroid isomerase-like protein